MEDDNIKYYRKIGELFSQPRCGDMWELSGKRTALVDFVDEFVGITLSSGQRVGFGTRNDFEAFIRAQGGVNISRWEHGWWPKKTHQGFSIGRPLPREEAARHICDMLSIIEEKPVVNK